MIIISDAHINETTGNHFPFFEMLTALESCNHDLIFLGDIFDLWIALPRYEKEIHQRFLAWCKEQKQRRVVGFIEGNHEYFLADERKEFFSWCTADAFRQDEDGVVYCHGDQVNRFDEKYLLFRKLAKNAVAKRVLRWIPIGPKLVEHLKVRMKETNLEFKKQLPRQEIEYFAENRFRKGGNTVFVGHFHQAYCYQSPGGGELHTVCGWSSGGMVTFFERKRKTVTHLNWKALLDSKFLG